MLNRTTGNYADLDYSGKHRTITGFIFDVYIYHGEWYYAECYAGDPIGPFATSADAYHDAQGF